MYSSSFNFVQGWGDGMPFAIDGVRSHFTMLLFLCEEMRYLLVSGAGKDTLGQLYSLS